MSREIVTFSHKFPNNDDNKILDWLINNIGSLCIFNLISRKYCSFTTIWKKIKCCFITTIHCAYPSYSNRQNPRFTFPIVISFSLFTRFSTERLPFVPKSKKWLGGRRFTSNDEAMQAVDGYFEELDKWTYEIRITSLKMRWLKWI